MTVKKPIPEQLLQPIVTAANMTMNRSEFPEISSNLLKARENSRTQTGRGFGFASLVEKLPRDFLTHHCGAYQLQLPHYFKLFYGSVAS